MLELVGIQTAKRWPNADTDSDTDLSLSQRSVESLSAHSVLITSRLMN